MGCIRIGDRVQGKEKLDLCDINIATKKIFDKITILHSFYESTSRNDVFIVHSDFKRKVFEG